MKSRCFGEILQNSRQEFVSVLVDCDRCTCWRAICCPWTIFFFEFAEFVSDLGVMSLCVSFSNLWLRVYKFESVSMGRGEMFFVHWVRPCPCSLGLLMLYRCML